MHPPLYSKSITELAHLIRNKDIQVIELVREMLDRIETMNEKLNAFITVNPDAEAIAHQLDQQLKEDIDIGPLYGIPIAVKDMIDTHDMKTTMGSKIYENFVPTADARVVEHLQNAGAIIIGKTNTHQFAYGPTGDRSHFGPMRNPYDPTKMAGGSSGGSAVSVTAGLSSGALGTDTSGSVRIPASFCGLVGMKPTNSLLPLKGVFPLSGSLDVVGPMTKTVADNALMLNVLQSDGGNGQYTQSIGEDIAGLSIGIPYPHFFETINEEIAANFEMVKQHLKDAGAKIHDLHIPEIDIILKAQRTIIAYESYQVHAENVARYPGDWEAEVKERIEKTTQTEADYREALHVQHASRVIFYQAMQDVDALLTPTTSILPPDINQRVLNHVTTGGTDKTVDVRSEITRLSAPSNIAGLPSLTLPSGLSKAGMPFGVQLIGKDNHEATLYQIGYALEQSLQLNLDIPDVTNGEGINK